MYRRRKLTRRPFPHEWEATLRQSCRHFACLPTEQRDRAKAIIQVMVAEKDWAGAGDLQVAESMRVTIAGHAAVMASGFADPYYFDRLHAIVVHPRAIAFRPEQTARNPWLPSGTLAGVAWRRGPVMLSWADILREQRGRRPGGNVVMHEFAHHLDGLDGEMDGVPPLKDASAEQRWRDVAESEFLRLVGKSRRQESSLLDSYGAESPAEFFAVATECFFETPHPMRRLHGDLYAVLSDFYRQDPSQWLPPSEQIHVEPQSQPQGPRRPTSDAARDGKGSVRRRMRREDERRLRALKSMSAGDALFTLGLVHL
ncbi:MAG: M90 family metallopeptidase, partial [Planctomycetota bacterium]